MGKGKINPWHYITNLTCDELIIKLSKVHPFIDLYILHMIIMHWKHVWHMYKCIDKWGMNLWMNKCHTNFTSSYKFMCQMSFQCMISMHETYELWMNKFCMISITNLWDLSLWCKV
jgi:hypothetical protein